MGSKTKSARLSLGKAAGIVLFLGVMAVTTYYEISANLGTGAGIAVAALITVVLGLFSVPFIMPKNDSNSTNRKRAAPGFVGLVAALALSFIICLLLSVFTTFMNSEAGAFLSKYLGLLWLVIAVAVYPLVKNRIEL